MSRAESPSRLRTKRGRPLSGNVLVFPPSSIVDSPVAQSFLKRREVK